jgi:lauroyl/myristoyl acyltransferase
MPDSILDRWLEDVRRLQSPRGNVDIPHMVAGWLEDTGWVTTVRELSPDERRRRLGEIGRKTFERDVGRFATQLRWNTRSLSDLWSPKERELVLQKHVELLFASASDAIDFLLPDSAQQAARHVGVSGVEHLERAFAVGKGVILLGAYQCHPGFLLYHPLLASRRIAAIQHEENGGSGHTARALTEDRRLLLLPDSRASVRTILELLGGGQCVMLYNDFIYPSVPSIKSPLFGRWVLTSRALVSIALKTGASVLPFAIARQWPFDGAEVQLDFFPQLPLAGSDDTCAEQLEAAAFLFGLATECLIRRYPAQWRLWNTLESRWQEAEKVA